MKEEVHLVRAQIMAKHFFSLMRIKSSRRFNSSQQNCREPVNRQTFSIKARPDHLNEWDMTTRCEKKGGRKIGT